MKLWKRSSKTGQDREKKWLHIGFESKCDDHRLKSCENLRSTKAQVILIQSDKDPSYYVLEKQSEIRNRQNTFTIKKINRLQKIIV